MAQKHLIRRRVLDLPPEYGFDAMLERNRAEVDEFMSDYIPVHTMDVSGVNARSMSMSSNARDDMSEIGRVLYVSPVLVSADGPSLEDPQTPLEKILAEIGYDKRIVPGPDCLHQGGLVVTGERFLLVSEDMPFDMTSKHMGVEVTIREETGLHQPAYSLSHIPTLFSQGRWYVDENGGIVANMDSNGHIDCRFMTLDRARIIYMAMGARPGTMREGKNHIKEKTFRTLKKAAKRSGYELRDYPLDMARQIARAKDPEFVAAEKKFDAGHLMGALVNGINFITDGDHLFTSALADSEREYLEGRGVTAIEVPLKYAYNGAGLRCLYGEVTVG